MLTIAPPDLSNESCRGFSLSAQDSAPLWKSCVRACSVYAAGTVDAGRMSIRPKRFCIIKLRGDVAHLAPANPLFSGNVRWQRQIRPSSQRWSTAAITHTHAGAGRTGGSLIGVHTRVCGGGVLFLSFLFFKLYLYLEWTRKAAKLFLKSCTECNKMLIQFKFNKTVVHKNSGTKMGTWDSNTATPAKKKREDITQTEIQFVNREKENKMSHEIKESLLSWVKRFVLYLLEFVPLNSYLTDHLAQVVSAPAIPCWWSF